MSRLSRFKRFFGWCPSPEPSGLLQYKKPAIAIVSITVIVIASSFSVWLLLFAGQQVTAPIIHPISTMTPAPTDPSTPTITPKPTVPIISPTDSSATQPPYSPIPTPFPSQSSWLVHTLITIDGKWTNETEWTITPANLNNPGQYSPAYFGNNVFREAWFDDVVDSTTFPINVTSKTEYFLIESADSTDDATDYWQLCIDSNSTVGSAPQTDDYRIDIIGHHAVTWYSGNGTGWAVMSTPPPAVFEWANTLSSSPQVSTAHWICEIKLDTKALGINPGSYDLFTSFNLRIAIFDASNANVGAQTWPTSPSGSRDNPSNWGIITHNQLL
jgi:hypothetical protein